MKNPKQTFAIVVTIGLVCAVPSCTLIRCAFASQGDGSGGSLPSFRYRHAEGQYEEWCGDFPRYIIPRICAYYQLHPEQFKPTGHGEEIEITGFTDFVKNDPYFKEVRYASVWAGKVRDPWGNPVGFVEDFNMDGYIDVLGQHTKINMNFNKPATLNYQHHFGIFKKSPFKGPYGNPSERIVARIY